MEITVRKFDLLQELLLLQGVVERKTTIPILANILAEATPEGRLLLAATDLELGLETSCAATVKKSGACALPARKLLDYVRLLPDADITLKRLENHWVSLRCGRANTRMVGMSRENFPELAVFPPSGGLRLPAAPLAAMIAKTIFAISNEESRYTLNGALLVLKPMSLALVATDGHRLAHIVQDQTPLEGVGSEIKALVPKKAMAELLGLLEQAPEDASVEFAQDETHLFFRVPMAGGGEGRVRLLTARKLSGQFPNYEAVLPKAQLHSVPLNRGELAAAIKRVAQFADERSHAIRVRIEPNKLVLASSSSDMGESDEEMDTTFEGEPVMIGFNWKYLEEFLDAVSSEEVLLEFKDDSSAGQLRPRDNNGAQYRYVIMPMRI
ncbi:MAG TPA: DNA polymerase III subunit beta [Terriglobales bacterium]|nr:DNA polymerase III subunit beta [Terriglobales bacterium]